LRLLPPAASDFFYSPSRQLHRDPGWRAAVVKVDEHIDPVALKRIIAALDGPVVITIAVGVYLAMSVTDVGKELGGLSMLAQRTLKQDPFSGHLVVFRGPSAAVS
jgi:transposase